MDAREIAWQEEQMLMSMAKAMGADISHLRKECQEMPSHMYERLFGEKKADFFDGANAPEIATTPLIEAEEVRDDSNA